MTTGDGRREIVRGAGLLAAAALAMAAAEGVVAQQGPAAGSGLEVNSFGRTST